MSIKKSIVISILSIFIIGSTGCSKNKTNNIITENCQYNIEDYSISNVNSNEDIMVIHNARYNEATQSFTVYGKKSILGAEFFENQLPDNSNIFYDTIDPKYSYEPYYFKDDTIWGNGLNTNGSQDDNYSVNTTVKSLYIDKDDVEYRLLFMNNSSNYSIDIRNKDNSIKYSGNIVSINGMSEIFQDIKSVVFSDIKKYKSYIYLLGYNIDFSGNQKEYIPFIITINSQDYSLVDIKKEFDIPGADKMLVDDNGDILIEFYDSSKNKTYLYDVNKENRIEFDNDIHILSYNNADCIYLDNQRNICKYNFKENDSSIINTLDMINDSDDYSIISYTNNAYTFIKQNNIIEDVKMNISADGNITPEIQNDNDFILNEENENILFENLTKTKTITAKIDTYIDINSFYYDDNFFYLSDNNAVYIFDYSGNLSFQKDFNSISNLRIFRNNEKNFVASYNTDKHWNVYKMDELSKEVTKIDEINKYIYVDENTEFINGDSNYDFYIFNKGIIYGYNINTIVVPLIDLSSAIISGEIKGIHFYDESSTIEIISSYEIKILKPKAKTTNEKVRITVNVADISKYSPIIEKYNASQIDSELVISTSELTDFSNAINFPDIIISNQYTDIINLLQMNIFEDINAKSDLIKTNFNKSVVKAYMSDNKLYAFPLTFYLRGINLYSDERIDESTFNLKDFERLSENNEYSNSGFMSLFILDGNKEFINFQEKKSNYNSKQFIDILSMMPNFSSSESRYFISNDPLCPYSLKSNYLDNLYYFVGIPSDKGSTVYVQSDDLLMISNSSESKEECMEFLNFLINEDNQKELSSLFNFPINDNLYQKCIDDIAVETDIEYANNVTHLIDDNIKAYIPDSSLQNIISEILFSFENEEYDAESAAQILNNKVNIYLNELLH